MALHETAATAATAATDATAATAATDATAATAANATAATAANATAATADATATATLSSVFTMCDDFPWHQRVAAMLRYKPRQVETMGQSHAVHAKTLHNRLGPRVTTYANTLARMLQMLKIQDYERRMQQWRMQQWRMQKRRWHMLSDRRRR